MEGLQADARGGAASVMMKGPAVRRFVTDFGTISEIRYIHAIGISD